MRIVHIADLQKSAGTELNVLSFLAHARERVEAQAVYPVHGEPAGRLRGQVSRWADEIFRKKAFVRGVKVPKWPAGLRKRRVERFASRYRGGVALFWNQSDLDWERRVCRQHGVRTVFLERGTAWLHDSSDARVRRFLEGVDEIVTNCRAGARMIEEKWGDVGPVAVVRNSLRYPYPDRGERCAPDPHGPIRLGMAARLVPLKGCSVALHALSRLRVAEYDCELAMAGSGPLRPRLEALARRLGVRERVRFGEYAGDIDAFYDHTDIVIHPALREPCSNTLIEAQAHGCPVVATLVDGVPEILAEGMPTVAPSLDIAQYRRLEAAEGPLPDCVYDPERDCLRSPMAPSPIAVAAAVDRLISDGDAYVRLSRAARYHVAEGFMPGTQTRRLLARIGA